MTSLRIRIGEQWPQVLKAPWVLLDDAGRLLQAGEGEPAQWPAASGCELVLSAVQTTWLEVSLPRLPGRERLRALAYALEERLVREPDSQHLTPLGPLQGRVDVLVMARDRLRQVLAPLAAARRQVTAAYSELQCAVAGAGTHLTIYPDGAVIRTDDRPPLAVDLDGERMPATLATLLQPAPAAGAASPRLTVHAQAAAALPWLSAANASMGNARTWYERPDDAVSLLHGEFAPRRAGDQWLRRLWPAALALVVLLMADVALSLGQWGWLRYRLAAREQDIATAFASAFPGMPLVDARLQVRRQLDAARAAAGQLRSDDALALMADLAEAMPGLQVRSVRFESGRLEVAVPESDALAGIEGRLGQRDILAVRQSAQAGEVHLVLRRGATP
jgi:general secretion pathway protein L